MSISVVLPSPLDSHLERLVSATGLTQEEVLDGALRLWACARNVSLAPGQTAPVTASRKRRASGRDDEEEDGGLQVANVQSGGEAGGASPAATSPGDAVSHGWQGLPEAVADTLFPLLKTSSSSQCARLVCRAWAGHVFRHLRVLRVNYWRLLENGQEGPRRVDLDKTVPQLKSLSLQQESWANSDGERNVAEQPSLTPMCTEFLGSVTRLKNLQELYLHRMSMLSASDLVILKPVLYQLVVLTLSSRRDFPLPAEQLISVLGPLKKLEILDIGFDEPGQYCKQRDTVWLGSLGPNLKALRLEGARFSAEGFGALGGLTSLTNLELENCSFDHNVGGWHALAMTLSSLKTLGFHGPMWPPSMRVMHISSMTSLEQLTITSMSAFPREFHFFGNNDEAQIACFDEDVEEIGSNLTGLTMLTIRGYRILSAEPLRFLSRLTRLTHLQLNDVHPDGFIIYVSRLLSAVSNLTSLETLSFVSNDMDICAEDIRCMQPLLNLTSLELGGATIEPRVLVAVQALPALKALALYASEDGEFSDSIENHITALAPLHQLRSLCLGGSSSLKSLARLNNALPKLDGFELSCEYSTSHPEIQALQEVLKHFKAALPVLLKSMVCEDKISSWHGSLLTCPCLRLIHEAEETVQLCADVVKLRSQLSRCCIYKSQGVQPPKPDVSLTTC